MKERKTVICALMLILALIACGGGNADVVESGVYQGNIERIDPMNTEVYVRTLNGKRLALFISEATVLTYQGHPVEFSTLKEGMSVEIEVEKSAQRMEPIFLKVLE